MRGRLINPFLAKIAQLDTVATATAGGYDDDFDDVKKNTDGTTKRVDKTPILVPCQVEVGVFEALMQVAAGDLPKTEMHIVFHFADLEEMGLVDADTGQALIRVDDKLISIHRFADGSLIELVNPKAGGLYITEAQPQSFGLSGGERNLLVCTLDQRDQGKAGP